MRKPVRKNSRKIKCSAAILAAMMLLATGCGEEEKVIDGSVQNIQPVAVGNEADTASSEAGQPGQDQENGQESGQGDTGVGSASGKGFVFSHNGATIEMDVDAAPILEKLGEPVSYFEAQSCAFEGLDKTYTYNGFELDTYPKGDKDYVSAVVLKDDSVATAEGICIGDSLEKLQQAYPEGGTEECNMMIYEKDGMRLCFFIKGDEVASIEYRSTVLN